MDVELSVVRLGCNRRAIGSRVVGKLVDSGLGKCSASSAASSS
jgi:hypothetical protein